MIGILGVTSALVTAYGATATGAVHLSGAVNKPGAYVVSSPQSVQSAIQNMGGFALNADKRHIRIVSQDGTVRNVDLTSLGTIPTVQPGERVEVRAIDPTTSVVVQGGVSRAGAFDFKPGMTVLDAVKQAEPTKHAAMKSVKVLRRADDGTVQVTQADLLAMSGGKTAPLELRAGDTVAVPLANVQTSDRELLTIVLIGLLILVIVD